MPYRRPLSPWEPNSPNGDQIPQIGTNFEAVLLSEYQVQIKFQMFTITSAVPSDMPMLASSEQQRFAVDNQDVLPQGPLQPANVGLHPGQPPPLWQPQLPPFQNRQKC